MSSTRLPGKVMLPLAGKPMIQQIVDRANACRNVGEVIVATSSQESDDALASYCEQNQIKIFRGSLTNVLSRYVHILESTDYEYCVRITGDCPLIHPPFIDAQIDALIKYEADFTWFSRHASVFEGQGVISKRAVSLVGMNSNDPDDLEHVGSKYFLINHNKFKFVEMVIPDFYYSFKYRFTLDEMDDYRMLSDIFDRSWSNEIPNMDDILGWLEEVNETHIHNRNVMHSSINQELEKKRETFTPSLVGSWNWKGM